MGVLITLFSSAYKNSTMDHSSPAKKPEVEVVYQPNKVHITDLEINEREETFGWDLNKFLTNHFGELEDFTILTNRRLIRE